MKFNSKILIISILALGLLFLSFQLYNKNKVCEACKLVKVDEIDLPGKSDLRLKIDFENDSEFQPFQFDIVNSYSILGKLETNRSAGTIESVLFGTVEAGTCKRFRIEHITHDKRDLGGEEVHWFTVKIKNTGDNGGDTLRLTKSIPIQKGETIYTQVISEDKRIETHLQTANDGEPQMFPPYVCAGRIM